MDNATKRPWRVQVGDHPAFVSVYSGDKHVANVENGEQPWSKVLPEWQANASLIVTAVNQHDALLKCAEALRIAEAVLSNVPYEFETTTGGRIPVCKASKARDMARAALTALETSNGKG